jgi:hypothetical protein
MLDYYDSDANEELVVTFEKCHFRDNRYFGFGAQTSLIMGNSDQNRIKISKTIFSNNNMKWNTTTVCCDHDNIVTTSEYLGVILSLSLIIRLFSLSLFHSSTL